MLKPTVRTVSRSWPTPGVSGPRTQTVDIRGANVYNCDLMVAKSSPSAKRKAAKSVRRPQQAGPYSEASSARNGMRHETRVLSIREKAYLYIQELISNGSLVAGSSISELMLAKNLGSSRTPVREAMNQLAAEGLLTQSANGGMVVAQLTRDDIIELYEMREALEVYAAGKISRRQLRPTDKLRLQQLVDEVARLEKEIAKSKRPALDTAQMERFIACDLGFHALLMSLTNNSRLQKLIHETRLLISIFAIHRGGHDAATLKSIGQYHQRILDAVDRQDGPAAMIALAEHIQTSKRERLDEFDEWKRESSLRQSVPVFFDIHKMVPGA
jgi:DNA-binding GntR family transcriptional regulator